MSSSHLDPRWPGSPDRQYIDISQCQQSLSSAVPATVRFLTIQWWQWDGSTGSRGCLEGGSLKSANCQMILGTLETLLSLTYPTAALLPSACYWTVSLLLVTNATARPPAQLLKNINLGCCVAFDIYDRSLIGPELLSARLNYVSTASVVFIF